MKPHAHKYQANITTELFSVRSAGKNFLSHFCESFKDYIGVCVYECMRVCIYVHTCMYMYICVVYLFDVGMF